MLAEDPQHGLQIKGISRTIRVGEEEFQVASVEFISFVGLFPLALLGAICQCHLHRFKGKVNFSVMVKLGSMVEYEPANLLDGIGILLIFLVLTIDLSLIKVYLLSFS